MIVANIFTDLTEWLDEFSSNWWFLFVIFGVALLDSVIPVVPGETTVIAGGVAAGAGNQSLALVILAGASGAFIGDNLAYTIGRQFRPRVEAWAARKQQRAATTRRGRSPDPQARWTAADHRTIHPRRTHGPHGVVGPHRATPGVVRLRGSRSRR